MNKRNCFYYQVDIREHTLQLVLSCDKTKAGRAVNFIKIYS